MEKMTYGRAMFAIRMISEKLNRRIIMDEEIRVHNVENPRKVAMAWASDERRYWCH